MSPTETPARPSTETAPPLLSHMRDHADVFCCPLCGGPLRVAGERIECGACGRAFGHDAGIPLLFVNEGQAAPTDEVTDRVRSFYEQHPFPSYDDVEDVGALMQRADAGMFPRWLRSQVPFGVKVLEVGCGTGQMSNFLGVGQRTVFGADMSLPSLRLAQRFRDENGLSRVGFYQMNLFRPAFRPESFDLVVCSGVLHHTAEPFRAFRTIARLVKPGGYILLGLYNTYGRLLTDVRRWIFRLTGDRMKFLDRHWRDGGKGLTARWTWYLDQYRNPHESKHTYGEVLRWLDTTGFGFVSALPRITAAATASDHEEIFTPQPRGSRIDRGLVQARLMLAGREGGFFLITGRKRRPADARAREDGR